MSIPSGRGWPQRPLPPVYVSEFCGSVAALKTGRWRRLSRWWCTLQGSQRHLHPCEHLRQRFVICQFLLFGSAQSLVARATEFCTALADVWGSSAWNWLRVNDPSGALSLELAVRLLEDLRTGLIGSVWLLFVCKLIITFDSCISLYCSVNNKYWKILEYIRQVC